MGDSEQAPTTSGATATSSAASLAQNVVLHAPSQIHGIQPPMGLNLKRRYKVDNWKGCRQHWENYSIITQLDKQTEDYEVALFLYCIGPEAVKTYNSFDLAQEDKQNLTLIVEEFEKYAVGDVKETYERFIFNS